MVTKTKQNLEPACQAKCIFHQFYPAKCTVSTTLTASSSSLQSVDWKCEKKPLQGTMLIIVAEVEARMLENLLLNSIFLCV